MCGGGSNGNECNIGCDKMVEEDVVLRARREKECQGKEVEGKTKNKENKPRKCATRRM